MEPTVKTRFQKFEYREISRGLIHGASYNPRKIEANSRDLLKKKLEQVGCVEPLVWNERTGNLVSGHQRLSILDELEGRTDYGVAVAVVDLSDKQERELNVFLNNHKAQGTWDKDAFARMLEGGGDLSEMGLTTADIEKEFGKALSGDASAGDQSAMLKDAYQVLVNCVDERQQACLLQNLTRDGYECRALIS